MQKKSCFSGFSEIRVKKTGPGILPHCPPSQTGTFCVLPGTASPSGPRASDWTGIWSMWSTIGSNYLHSSILPCLLAYVHFCLRFRQCRTVFLQDKQLSVVCFHFLSPIPCIFSIFLRCRQCWLDWKLYLIFSLLYPARCGLHRLAHKKKQTNW